MTKPCSYSSKIQFSNLQAKKNHIFLFKIFCYGPIEHGYLTPPLQASQPELADERPKKNLNRIFAENIVRCHPEEQLYQVW